MLGMSSAPCYGLVNQRRRELRGYAGRLPEQLRLAAMTENAGLAKQNADAQHRTANPVSDETRYQAALHSHLKGMDAKEIDFFVNSQRLRLIDQLIGPQIRRKGARVLNVASGPFAIEYYLQLRDADVLSFDREPRLAELHRDLVSSGLIGPSRFETADVYAFESSERFDAVIINDLFYSKYVDFYALIDRYVALLKPGAIFYFDIQDQRTGPIWRAFGKDSEYRRYDLGEVTRALAARGLKVEKTVPVLGIKGGLDRTIRTGLWHTLGLANSHVFVARKV